MGKIKHDIIAGQVFGQWTVLEPFIAKARAICRCSCGVERAIQRYLLRNGSTLSCGHGRKDSHRPEKHKDIAGRRFGWLIAVAPEGRNKKKSILWCCVCDCGGSAILPVDRLTSGNTKSCGCRKGDPLPYGEGSFNAIFRRYIRNAAQQNREFALTLKEFRDFTQNACYYCEQAPSEFRLHSKHNGPFVGSGLDRVDNAKGYTKDNCVPCCNICNNMKRSLPVKDFLAASRRIANNQTKLRPLNMSQLWATMQRAEACFS